MRSSVSVLVIALILFSTNRIYAQEIIAAATEGNLEKVAGLISNDSQVVNIKDSNGRTPLHWAARGVHFEVVKYLVENGAEINARDNNNITPIFSITSRNHAEALKYLIDRGADINVVDNQKAGPLHYAAEGGLNEMIKILIDNNAELELENSRGRTPLIVAARENASLETIKILIEYGANINAKDYSLDTPLSLAAWRGNEDIVNYLIDQNPEITISGIKGKTLFFYSMDKRLVKLYKAIMDRGARIEDLSSRGTSALHWAAKGGSGMIAEDLIEKGLQVNNKDIFGMTPLHYAAKYGRLSVVKLLIEQGANLNSKSGLEETPLNLAQKADKSDVVEYLILAGADKGRAQYTKLKGEYFGQKKPGNKPEIFAPGVISNLVNGHSNVTFSPDGKEAFWTEWNLTESGYDDGCTLLHSVIENGYWTIPEVIMKKGDTPIFSVDGKKVYFMASVSQANGQERGEIQYFERGKGVLTPKSSSFDLTGTGLYWQFSFDRDENLFFSSGNGLFRSLYIDGEYLPPERLSEIFHSDYNGGSPYISPSGDFIIFSSMELPDSYGKMDLYVGFRKADGTWTKPKNLGPEINGPDNDFLPLMTSDGDYLFYVSSREEASFLRLWVSGKIIDVLKRMELK